MKFSLVIVAFNLLCAANAADEETLPTNATALTAGENAALPTNTTAFTAEEEAIPTNMTTPTTAPSETMAQVYQPMSHTFLNVLQGQSAKIDCPPGLYASLIERSDFEDVEGEAGQDIRYIAPVNKGTYVNCLRSICSIKSPSDFGNICTVTAIGKAAVAPVAADDDAGDNMSDPSSAYIMTALSMGFMGINAVLHFI